MIAALAWMLPAWMRPTLSPELMDRAGAALAGRIREARRQVIAAGVHPIPAAVYRDMLGYFPAHLLQRCRYAVGGSRMLAVPRAKRIYGSTAVTTLQDVVVFRSARVAESDPRLWARELTRLMQFQRWGVEGFADRFVHDGAAVEQEVEDNATRFMAWREQRLGA